MLDEPEEDIIIHPNFTLKFGRLILSYFGNQIWRISRSSFCTNIRESVHKFTDDIPNYQESAHFLFRLYLASFLFFFWIFVMMILLWRVRIQYHNSTVKLHKSAHTWTTFTPTSYPKYCSSCEKLITGFFVFRNTGWQCSACGRCAHSMCLYAFDRFFCKCPFMSRPLRHQLIVGNLDLNSVCCVCGLICSSISGLNGARCLWCRRTCHEKCSNQLPAECDMGSLGELVLPPTFLTFSIPELSSLDNSTDIHNSQPPYWTQFSSTIQVVQQAMARNVHDSVAELTQSFMGYRSLLTKSAKKKFRRQVEDQRNAYMLTSSSDSKLGTKDKNDGEFEESNSNVLQFSNADIAAFAHSDPDKLAEVTCGLNASSSVWKIPRYRPEDMRRALSKKRPLIVFINTASGGNSGKELFKKFNEHLNPLQIVDMKSEGSCKRALEFFRPLAEGRVMRILVCGGDGSFKWVQNDLYEVYGNQTELMVPAAPMPIGTGNDLSRVLGWGSSFNGDVREYLQKLRRATTHALDSWSAKFISFDKKVLRHDIFTNYLDLGVAAKISWQFHQLRNLNPKIFQSQFGNKLVYGEVGLRNWLRRNPLEFRKTGFRLSCDDAEVTFPDEDIQGIILINVPSFAGGPNLWPNTHLEETERPGKSRRSSSQHHTFHVKSDSTSCSPSRRVGKSISRTSRRRKTRGSAEDAMSQTIDDRRHFASLRSQTPNRFKWLPQSYSDGIIEVVGVRNIYHLGQAQVGIQDPIKVCQGRRIKIEIPVPVPVQLDGEPMIADPCFLEVSLCRRTFALAPNELLTNSAKPMEGVLQALDEAETTGVITKEQKSLLVGTISARL